MAQFQEKYFVSPNFCLRSFEYKVHGDDVEWRHQFQAILGNLRQATKLFSAIIANFWDYLLFKQALFKETSLFKQNKVWRLFKIILMS